MDKRSDDRRKKNTKVKNDRRKGPRRITCGCGGKIEVKVVKSENGEFFCVRCGKKH